MLPLILPSWRVAYFADGLGLVPPQGPGHGAIRIRERRRPLRGARALVDAFLATSGLGAPTVAPIERFTTAEGEFAALTTVSGTVAGERFVRPLGFVFGDDFYTQLDGTTCDPGKTEFFTTAIRELTRCYSIGLGELRRRRYAYEPPAGWRGHERGLVTRWMAPGFPGEPTLLTVFPARPVAESLAGVLDRELHELSWTGFSKREAHETLPVATRHGLTGVHVRVIGGYDGGPARRQDLLALEDTRFVYVMRLESSLAQADASRQVFQQVCASIEPLPARAITPHAPSAGIGHWAE